MHPTLTKALLLGVPVCALLSYSALAFCRRKTLGSFLQWLGAICLAIVILSHVCEALQLLPSMGWGLKHSAGHYIDLSSAVMGLTLFPLGYLLQAIARRRA